MHCLHTTQKSRSHVSRQKSQWGARCRTRRISWLLNQIWRPYLQANNPKIHDWWYVAQISHAWSQPQQIFSDNPRRSPRKNPEYRRSFRPDKINPRKKKWPKIDSNVRNNGCSQIPIVFRRITSTKYSRKNVQRWRVFQQITRNWLCLSFNQNCSYHSSKLTSRRYPSLSHWIVIDRTGLWENKNRNKRTWR